jgi:CheY-like chemotaxis protein
VRDPRILVVDGEPEVLEVMVDMLEQEGYSPRSTSDNREASRLLEATAFDVIVSDIVMPHLSGLQLLEIARRQNPDVQVVLVTGYATNELAREALERSAPCDAP